jgi:hypothetical protein
MEKIVSITHYTGRLQRPAPIVIPVAAERWAADARAKAGARGVLLQFPGPYQGPLTAA